MIKSDVEKAEDPEYTANNRWITEEAREFKKNMQFCFTEYARASDCVDHNKLENA